MAKFTKGTFKSFINKKLVEHSGYLFDLLLDDNTVKRMGVYKCEESKWCVVDVITGLTLCDSIKRADAVARAESEPIVKKFSKLVASETDKTMRDRFYRVAGIEQEAAAYKEPEKPAPGTAIEVSLKTMEAWCKERNLLATQKREGCCIWVSGDSKPYAKQLKEMKFRWAPRRKAWYFDPSKA